MAWEESLQSPPGEDGGSLPEPSGEGVLVRCSWCCHGCQLLSFMARKPTTRGKGFQSGSIVPDYQTVVALPPACARPGTLPVHLIRRWRSEGVWSHCGVSIIPGYSRWPSSVLHTSALLLECLWGRGQRGAGLLTLFSPHPTPTHCWLRRLI